MSDNEHFIRSRSFSGWTHTLLVSRATASPWEVPTPERSGLLNVGPQAPDYDSSGPNLGFAVLKDLLMLLWPFVYSLSPPLFLLALALVGAFEIYVTETFDGIVLMTNMRALILGRLWSMKNIKAF